MLNKQKDINGATNNTKQTNNNQQPRTHIIKNKDNEQTQKHKQTNTHTTQNIR